LQDELGDGDVRLKYFMDPLIDGSDEPNGIGLFHSKLIYLLLESEQKSIVYIGSHNWSLRALGPGGPRNAEASLRFESDFVPEHLDGTGGSVAAEVNRHLLDAYSMPACLPAIRANEQVFEQWYQKGCRPAPSSPVERVTALLAVRKDDGAPASCVQWLSLKGRGIYMQALEETEGDSMWQSGDRIVVLVWKSKAELRAGCQPILLQCRETTHKAGPNSQRCGTNQSTAPVAGFDAIIFDEDQLLAMQQKPKTPRSSVMIWSGRPVEIFDFEFPTQRLDSAQVDAGVTPKYQFPMAWQHAGRQSIMPIYWRFHSVLPHKEAPMTRTSMIGLILAAALSATAVSADQAQKKLGYQPRFDKNGWEVLFDGKDLNAWEVVPGWVVTPQGELHVAKAGADLGTKQRYCDFELELDFRMGPKAKANSGVFLRTHDRHNPVGTGREVQILDNNDYNIPFDAPNANGAIYELVRPTVDANVPVGQWNHYHITANGNWIVVELNGKQMAKADLNLWKTAGQNPDGSHNKYPYAAGALPREGFLMLQNYGGVPVWFRNIRIKPLSDRKPRYTGVEPITQVLKQPN